MGEGRVSTFAAFRYRDFRLLWVGLASASLGNWMQQFALGWLVVQIAVREGQPALAPFYIGLIGASRAIPNIGLGVFGGVFADRMDRRILLSLTQGSTAVIAAVLSALTLADQINIPWIILTSVLLQVAGAFDVPTRQSMLPQMVPAEAILSGVGLNTAAIQGATFAGPLIGGLLIGPFGVGGLFAINAVSHLTILVALFFMGSYRVESSGPRPNILRAVGDGLAFARRDSVILAILLMNAAVGLVGRDAPAQLLPAFAHETLGVGAVELSWLFGASGLGTLVGAFITASLGGSRRLGLILGGSIAVAGGFMAALGAQHALLPALVVLFGGSLAINVCFGLTLGALQTRSPNELRGRVIALHLTTWGGFSNIGVLLIGSLGSLTGVSAALAVGGIGIVVVALATLARIVPLRTYGALPAGAPAR